MLYEIRKFNTELLARALHIQEVPALILTWVDCSSTVLTAFSKFHPSPSTEMLCYTPDQSVPCSFQTTPPTIQCSITSITGHVIVQAVIDIPGRWLKFDSRTGLVGFVVDRMAFEKFFPSTLVSLLILVNHLVISTV
jgi:hypothetical protein